MNKIQFILKRIKEARLDKGTSLRDVANSINIGEDWLNAVENNETTPTLELVYAISEAAEIDLASILEEAKNIEAKSTELSRAIQAEQEGENLNLYFQYNDHIAKYTLENATRSQYDELLADLRANSYNERIKKSDFVINTFFKAMDIWPDANPSDIWGFFLSRLYQDPYNHPVTEQNRDFAQSWKRTSGWVLEEIFVKHYKDFLQEHEIIISIQKKKEVKKYLQKMNLNYHDVEEKADVLLIDKKSDECFGVVHVKASLAERRQADQSFSEALLAKNYFSPFMTMDCKSTPSATPFNKGEFGPTKEGDTDLRINKRLDFEEEGYFSACYSFNSNTIPTPAGQKATSRIYTLDFKNPDDPFSNAAISARNKLFSS